MDFPEYELARHQSQSASATRYALGASAPEPLRLGDLLTLATEDELKQWRDFSLGYTPSQGDIGLRETICAAYPGLGPDNIVVTAGAQEGIFISYHALLSAGDKALVITPAFEPLVIIPKAIGADVAKAPMTQRHDGWHFDINRWVDALTADTCIVSVNFPHNPTGQTVSKSDFAEMIAACRKNACWMLSDEVFRGLEHDVDDRLPTAASVYEKGISIGVVSKPFGLGGIRVGWVACRDVELLQRMLHIKRFLSICNGRADEILAGIALWHQEALLQAQRQRIATNLSLIHANRGRLLPRVQWCEPRAGCIAYPKVRGQESSVEFAKQLLGETGVNIVPGNCFLQDPAHFRIGFGRNDFPQAFELMLDWLA